MTERRKSDRFSVPVLVILEQGIGLTHNINTSGVYFETNQCLDKDAGLLSFGLYFGESEDDKSWMYRCYGKIIRTESLDVGGMGVAVNILEVGGIENLYNGPSRTC